jgi:hypothetical protein
MPWRRLFQGSRPSTCRTIFRPLGVLNPDDFRHSEITVMGWERLDAKLGVERINESIRVIVQGMAGGHAKHQTDALKFGLYDVLRQKGSAKHSFARLRCPDVTCEGHRQPVSCPAGNSSACTKRKDRGFWPSTCSKIMQCSECGHVRKDHYTWCGGCRGMFG